MAKTQKQSRADVASMMAKSDELRKRIGYMLIALIVYRLGTHVPLPGIDAFALSHYQSNLTDGVFGLLNMFSGGAFSRMTVFALNVMPYITASIIVQLMTTVSPSLAEMRKEGEVGRRKMNQYTRYFTLILAFVQGFGLASGMEGATVSVGSETMGVVIEPGMMFRLQTALTLMTGTMFLMWLGEQMTVKGIGSGISVIIFAGIVAELPKEIFQTIEQVRVGELGGHLLLAIAVMVVVTIMAVVHMETAQRRVPVQYPKRQTPQGGVMNEGSHMPLKINMSGVMPAIFASSLLVVPMSIAQFAPNAEWARELAALFAPGKIFYMAFYATMIILFCYFYTSVIFNSEEKAGELKKGGAFIPGIRPGPSTAEFFDYVLTRLTAVGAVYMVVICLMPQMIMNQFNVPFSSLYGGTSLLIVVSVTIDLVARIQTHIIAQRYESLLKKSKFRGRK